MCERVRDDGQATMQGPCGRPLFQDLPIKLQSRLRACCLVQGPSIAIWRPAEQAANPASLQVERRPSIKRVAATHYLQKLLDWNNGLVQDLSQTRLYCTNSLTLPSRPAATRKAVATQCTRVHNLSDRYTSINSPVNRWPLATRKLNAGVNTRTADAPPSSSTDIATSQ